MKTHIEYVKKVKKSAWVYSLIILISFASCKKLVEVDAPSNSLVTSSVFDNDASAIAAQLAVYAKLYLYEPQLEINTGLSGDELTYYGTTQIIKDIYHNNLTAQSDGGVNGIWSAFYSA